MMLSSMSLTWLTPTLTVLPLRLGMLGPKICKESLMD